MEKAENTRYAAVAVHDGYGLSQSFFSFAGAML